MAGTAVLFLQPTHRQADRQAVRPPVGHIGTSLWLAGVAQILLSAEPATARWCAAPACHPCHRHRPAVLHAPCLPLLLRSGAGQRCEGPRDATPGGAAGGRTHHTARHRGCPGQGAVTQLQLHVTLPYLHVTLLQLQPGDDRRWVIILYFTCKIRLI